MASSKRSASMAWLRKSHRQQRSSRRHDAKMRLAAPISPASSCMAAPVRIWDSESCSSTANRVRSSVLSSACALADRSRNSSSPLFSERRCSILFQKRIPARSSRRKTMRIDRRNGVHHGGRFRMTRSSARSMTSMIPFISLPFDMTLQLSVSRTHVPVRRTRHPGSSDFATCGCELKSTVRSHPSTSSRNDCISLLFFGKPATFPQRRMRRP